MAKSGVATWLLGAAAKVAFWLFVPFLVLAVCCLIAFQWLADLPMIVCRQLRAGRWLPVLGPAYYAAFIPAIATVVQIPWWLTGFILVGAISGCFPPGPATFFFRPRVRRAVFRVLEHVERVEGLRVNYSSLTVVSHDNGWLTVRFHVVRSPAIRGFYFPLQRAVNDGGDVLDLTPAAAATAHETATPPRQELPFA